MEREGVSERQGRMVLDANVLVSAVNSRDANHVACYCFLRERPEAQWVVPTLAYFEFQAAQSRIRREGGKALRELHLPNVELVDITANMLREASAAGLFDDLASLRGADLVYGCVAALQDIPLATSDLGFRAVEDRIRIVWVSPQRGEAG